MSLNSIRLNLRLLPVVLMSRGVLFCLNLRHDLGVRLSGSVSPILGRIKHILEVFAVGVVAALAHGGGIALFAGIHLNSGSDPLVISRQ